MKLGMSVLVLPGRNPVVLAKELATLDRLSGGRLLPAFGLGVADPHEQQAFGVERGERARMFDELLAIVRACWTQDVVDHDGPRFRYEGLRVLPKPHQSPPDVWLGGIAPSELKRDAPRRRVVAVLRHPGRCRTWSCRDRAGRRRTRASDRFGALRRADPLRARSGTRCGAPSLSARRPDIDPSELVPDGWDALQNTVRRFMDVGTSKFVVLPIVEPPTPDAWRSHLAKRRRPSFPCRRDALNGSGPGAQTRDMSIRPTALFVIDGQAVSPTELSRGPWDPTACHGGPIGVARPLHRSSAGRWHRLAAGPCDGRAHPAGAARSRCESTPRWCDRDGRWRSSKSGSCAHPTAWRWPALVP